MWALLTHPRIAGSWPIASTWAPGDEKSNAIAKPVSTGWWIGRAMREAVLVFAFDGLGAAIAESAAWEENTASLGVSRAVGYVENGFTMRVFDGKRHVQQNLVLERSSWRSPAGIRIDGLTPAALAFMGLTS